MHVKKKLKTSPKKKNGWNRDNTDMHTYMYTHTHKYTNVTFEMRVFYMPTQKYQVRAYENDKESFEEQLS